MTFAEEGEPDGLTVEHRVQRNEGFPGAGGARIGWEQTLARLGTYLESGSV